MVNNQVHELVISYIQDPNSLLLAILKNGDDDLDLT